MDELASINIEQSRILVVDDDEIIRKLLRRVLERSHFVVDEASSGEQAILRIQDEQPDLILLDVVMDGMDGFSTCRKIKELKLRSDIPIIFVTGRSDTGSIVEGLDAGGRDYITKPINRHEALARIRNHLALGVLMKYQAQFIEGLREANLAKNRIIGVASHDLRNPIASIRGLTDFLTERGPLNDGQTEIVETIQTTCGSILQLVDELLDLSVIEGGEEHSNEEACSIRHLVSSSVNIYQFTANKKNILLSLVNEGEIPELLMLDKMQFRRLVDNLLSNAIKYSPEHSSIVVSLKSDGNSLFITVEDEGPGIPEDEMHKLFTDFGTTSVKPTGNETSTGLGLSICKTIAEAHKGKLTVANREDRSGARFTLELSIAALKVFQMPKQ